MKKLVNESLYEFEDQIHSRIQDESDENEGAHYKVKLEEIVQMSKDLYSKLPEGRIPAWVGDKIVVAKEYIYAVTSWLHGIEEQIEGEEMGANREMDADEEHEEFEQYPEQRLPELPAEVENMVEINDIDDEPNIFMTPPIMSSFKKIR